MISYKTKDSFVIEYYLCAFKLMSFARKLKLNNLEYFRAQETIDFNSNTKINKRMFLILLPLELTTIIRKKKYITSESYSYDSFRYF